MTGRMRRRVRPFLLAALGLSLVWAAYWVWPSTDAEPDFAVKISWNDIIEYADNGSKQRPPLPYYSKGRFFSVDGKPIAARDVIRDERHPSNAHYHPFTASFFLDDGSTQADFARAARQIWAVCDVPIFIAAHGQKEMPALLPAKDGRNCASIFPLKG